nr:unnamed protein product [Callosobruchus chinensis]CAH7767036.1 unnamed protein product [Callosobruchus chinensis]
MLIIYY